MFSTYVSIAVLKFGAFIAHIAMGDVLALAFEVQNVEVRGEVDLLSYSTKSRGSIFFAFFAVEATCLTLRVIDQHSGT